MVTVESVRMVDVVLAGGNMLLFVVATVLELVGCTTLVVANRDMFELFNVVMFVMALFIMVT